MDPEDIFASAARFPDYLTTVDKEKLRRALRDRHSSDYYSVSVPDNPLQGDGYRCFLYREFLTGRQKIISGIVLSNSCDMDLSNDPAADAGVVFAPLIQMSRIESMLRDNDVEEEKVRSTCANIRKQYFTRYFFLPTGPGNANECVVALDDVQSLPLSYFIENRTTRLFALSNFGFYMLLVKLSVHFMRQWEGVNRH